MCYFLIFIILVSQSMANYCYMSVTKSTKSKMIKKNKSKQRQIYETGCLLPQHDHVIEYDDLLIIQCVGLQTLQTKQVVEEDLECELVDMYGNHINRRYVGHRIDQQWFGEIWDEDKNKIIGYYSNARDLSQTYQYKQHCIIDND